MVQIQPLVADKKLLRSGGRSGCLELIIGLTQFNCNCQLELSLAKHRIFQMYAEAVPLLTKGSFAKFFVGPSFTSGINQSPTPVHPFSISVSLVCQIMFILFKKKQLNVMQTPTSYNRRSTNLYQNQIRNTLLSGFNNAYTIVCILVFTLGMGVWMVMHYAFIYKHSNNIQDTSEQVINLPGSIVGLACLLCGMNILQFKKNRALR